MCSVPSTCGCPPPPLRMDFASAAPRVKASASVHFGRTADRSCFFLEGPGDRISLIVALGVHPPKGALSCQVSEHKVSASQVNLGRQVPCLSPLPAGRMPSRRSWRGPGRRWGQPHSVPLHAQQRCWKGAMGKKHNIFFFNFQVFLDCDDQKH